MRLFVTLLTHASVSLAWSGLTTSFHPRVPTATDCDEVVKVFEEAIAASADGTMLVSDCKRTTPTSTQTSSPTTSSTTTATTTTTPTSSPWFSSLQCAAGFGSPPELLLSSSSSTGKPCDPQADRINNVFTACDAKAAGSVGTTGRVTCSSEGLLLAPVSGSANCEVTVSILQAALVEYSRGTFQSELKCSGGGFIKDNSKDVCLSHFIVHYALTYRLRSAAEYPLCSKSHRVLKLPLNQPRDC